MRPTLTFNARDYKTNKKLWSLDVPYCPKSRPKNHQPWSVYTRHFSTVFEAINKLETHTPTQAYLTILCCWIWKTKKNKSQVYSTYVYMILEMEHVRTEPYQVRDGCQRWKHLFSLYKLLKGVPHPCPPAVHHMRIRCLTTATLAQTRWRWEYGKVTAAGFTLLS